MNAPRRPSLLSLVVLLSVLVLGLGGCSGEILVDYQASSLEDLQLDALF